MKTREDLASLFESALDPNKAAKAIADLSAAFDESEAEFTVLKAENDKLKSDNELLRDTNAQLALRVTIPLSNAKKDPPADPTPEQALETLLNALKEE